MKNQFCSFAQESFSVTVRLNTSLPPGLMIATVSTEIAETLELVARFRCGIFHATFHPTLHHGERSRIQVRAEIHVLIAHPVPAQ